MITTTLCLLVPLVGMPGRAVDLACAQSLANSASARAPAASLCSLRALDDPALGVLRAGAPTVAQPLDATQRAELRRACDGAQGLAALRAGHLDVSDHDLGVIVVVALAVLVLAIIL